jgi:hypothetical protein
LGLSLRFLCAVCVCGLSAASSGKS